MGSFILFIIQQIIGLLILAIVVNVILSWLVAFEIINLRNPYALQFVRFLDAVVRPILAPFRRLIRPIGNVDVSPILALLVLQGVSGYLLPWAFEPLRRIMG